MRIVKNKLQGEGRKIEIHWDRKKLEKQESERNLPKIKSVTSCLPMFLQLYLSHLRWEVVLGQRKRKFLVLWLVADGYLITVAKHNNHKAAVCELTVYFKGLSTILISLIPRYFDNFGCP